MYIFSTNVSTRVLFSASITAEPAAPRVHLDFGGLFEAPKAKMALIEADFETAIEAAAIKYHLGGKNSL